MGEFNDSFFKSSMKCDFPARESFREALLETLLFMDEKELASASSDESAESRKDMGRIIKLEDDDLEMLAAAEGEDRASKHLLVDPFEQ